MEVTACREPILRLWAYLETPSSFRIEFPEADSHTWIAHIPSELVDDPLALWLTLNSTAERPLSRVRLDDGSILLSGALTEETAAEHFAPDRAVEPVPSAARSSVRRSAS